MKTARSIMFKVARTNTSDKYNRNMKKENRQHRVERVSNENKQKPIDMLVVNGYSVILLDATL